LRQVVHVVGVVHLTGKVTAQGQRIVADNSSKRLGPALRDLVEQSVDLGSFGHRRMAPRVPVTYLPDGGPISPPAGELEKKMKIE
jgi:hypothetical protein